MYEYQSLNNIYARRRQHLKQHNWMAGIAQCKIYIETDSLEPQVIRVYVDIAKMGPERKYVSHHQDCCRFACCCSCCPSPRYGI